MGSGETINGAVCPKCGGGEHNDKSFSITRYASCTKFICFRAKCGFSGIVKTTPVAEVKLARKAANARKSRTYTKPTRQLESGECRDMADTYHIRDFDVFKDVRIGCSDGRVLYPIYTHDGVRIGYAGKHAKLKPKVINYIPDPFIKLHFPLDMQYIPQENKQVVVIVEDVLSATRLVDNGVPAVALLGTNLSSEAAAHLITLGYKQWDVALDDDAIKKAAKIARKYSALAGINILTWPSKLDVKDMTETEFNEVFFKGE